AAATRVLSYWRNRVPDALDLLRKQARDTHPRVRLEAVRAASWFDDPEAIEVALIVGEEARGQDIDYTRKETLPAPTTIATKAIKEGKKVKFTTRAGERFMVKLVSTDILVKLDKSEVVNRELLFRKGVREEYRLDALTSLAKSLKKDEVEVLLEAIRKHDTEEAQDESVAFDLARLLTARRQK